MTPLRQRMLEDMQLRAFSPRTQEAYVRAVRQLATHFHKSPDLVTDEELRQYFLHLTQVQHCARATVTIALCGIKFFVEHTLGKTFTSLSLMRPPQTHRLPVVLSREEVWRILPLVRFPVYRVCLITIYACGLRLLEGARLQVSQVDSARGLVHVTGKGQVRPVRALAADDPHAAARPLAHPSLAPVALSRARPTGTGLSRRADGRTGLPLQPPVRVPSRGAPIRRAQARPRPHAATFVRHPSARSGRGPATDPDLPRPHQSQDDRALHPPDAGGETPRPRSDRST